MKEKALQEIVQIMQEHNLTLDDIAAFVGADIPEQSLSTMLSKVSCDVLIDSDGIQKRVPFEERTGKTILGLFPFKDDNHYLTLWEDESFRKFVDEERLPTIDFCKRLLPVLPIINDAFALLGKPPLMKGGYYAHASEDDNRNYIVSFECISQLHCERHDMSALAKARYVKEFHE